MVKINNQVPPGSVGRPAGRPATRKAEGKGADGVSSESDKVKVGNGEAMAIARTAASSLVGSRLPAMPGVVEVAG